MLTKPSQNILNNLGISLDDIDNDTVIDLIDLDNDSCLAADLFPMFFPKHYYRWLLSGMTARDYFNNK